MMTPANVLFGARWASWSHAPTLIALFRQVVPSVYLELGMGASTALGALAMPPDCEHWALDTNQAWADRHSLVWSPVERTIVPAEDRWTFESTRACRGKRTVALVDHYAGLWQRFTVAHAIANASSWDSRVVLHDCSAPELAELERGVKLEMGSPGALVVLGPNADLVDVDVTDDDAETAKRLLLRYAEWHG